MPPRREPDKTTYSGRFADRLRMLREKAKLTPEQVAEAVGVSKNTIYAWEAGVNLPSADKFPILAETLGTTPRTLIPKE